jgi:hypothetical protein
MIAHLNTQIENSPLNSGIHQSGAQISQDQKLYRLPFLVFLQTLASDSDFVRSEARSDRNYELYQTVLSRWQLAGYPRPREWQGAEYLQVGAYLHKWMLHHFEHGFGSDQEF